MATELERYYVAELERIAPGAKVGAVVPPGVTPLSFSYAIPDSVADVDALTFMAAEGYAAVRELAIAGSGPTHQCNHFARLTVQDRPEVKVPSQGGRGIPRKRERQFIVHALGWKAEGGTV